RQRTRVASREQPIPESAALDAKPAAAATTEAAKAETFFVPASLSAAAKRIPVKGGGFLAEGSKVTNIQRIQNSRGIRDVDRLVRTYGGQAQNWRKMKGDALLETSNGTFRRAE